MNTKNKPLTYFGNGLLQDNYGLSPYLPNEEIIQAVNVAIRLQRPLLVRGEPGCGKTRLAESVAAEFYKDRWRDHLQKWYIRSTTQAEDGLYSFDHVGRMRDSQIPEERGKMKEAYVSLGPIGRAIEASQKSKSLEIVLIDEIDKADIDMPNDLLDLLENYAFTIKETGQTFETSLPPLIIITSNDEKELSHAFLRRCIFLWIDLPDEIKLLEIAQSVFHSYDNKLLINNLEKLVNKFIFIYKELKNNRSQKLPSTSEMLDWLKAIDFGIQLNEFSEKNLNEFLTIETKRVPYTETLIKADQDNFLNQSFQ